MREAINDVLDWGHSVGILSLGTIEKQADKVVEEAEEAKKAIEKGDIYYIEQELGDVLVSTILQIRMCGLSFERCIENALNKNKNRPEGKMLDGEYVREKK